MQFALYRGSDYNLLGIIKGKLINRVKPMFPEK